MLGDGPIYSLHIKEEEIMHKAKAALSDKTNGLVQS